MTEARARGYQRVTLRRDEQGEIIAATWPAGVESGLHGHGASAATYYVHSGVIEEERFLPDGDSYRWEKVILRAGDQTHLPPGGFHNVHALEQAVTVDSFRPAPDDPTAVIPPETLRRLHKVRLDAIRHNWETGACRPNLLGVIDDLLPAWAEREEQATRTGELRLPAETLAEFRSSGLLLAPLPKQLHGWNTSLAETVRAIRLVARQAPATALALVMPLGNAATTRIPEQVVPVHLRSKLRDSQRWIAEQARQGRILAMANCEPVTAGDMNKIKTRAVLGADGTWRLTGCNSSTTFGLDADYFLVTAHRNGMAGGRPSDVIDGFFVARHAPGVTVDDRRNPVSLKATASVGVTLEQAPASAILGYPGCLEGVNSQHWSTVLFAGVCLGIGESALAAAREQVADSAVWARGTLAEQALNLDAAAAFVESVAREDCYPLPADLQARSWRAKTFVARVVLETATRAAMIAGAGTFTADHPVFRCLCDALGGPVQRAPLPNTMDAIVQQVFGMSACQNAY
jgi:alkylation response protein AidB-like acyl-CoA dehydrogenase